MSCKFSYILKVYEAKTATSNSDLPNPRCTIELHVRHRYQLKIPTNGEPAVVIEDLITSKQRITLQIPIIFPLTIWRQLHPSNILESVHLYSNTHSFLNPKVSEAIASIVERKVNNKGFDFDIVVKVGISKSETISEEEVSRIVAKLAKMKGSGNSSQLQSPAPDIIIIYDDDDQTEAKMEKGSVYSSQLQKPAPDIIIIDDNEPEAKMEEGSVYSLQLQKPAPDIIIIDDEDELESCM